MNTTISADYAGEDGIIYAGLSLMDGEIQFFGDARYLPIPLGQGLGKLATPDHYKKGHIPLDAGIRHLLKVNI